MNAQGCDRANANYHAFAGGAFVDQVGNNDGRVSEIDQGSTRPVGERAGNGDGIGRIAARAVAGADVNDGRDVAGNEEALRERDILTFGGHEYGAGTETRGTGDGEIGQGRRGSVDDDAVYRDVVTAARDGELCQTLRPVSELTGDGHQDVLALIARAGRDSADN